MDSTRYVELRSRAARRAGDLGESAYRPACVGFRRSSCLQQENTIATLIRITRTIPSRSFRLATYTRGASAPRGGGSGRCAHHVEVNGAVDAVDSSVAVELPDEPSVEVRTK